jgi:hypothetical protein
MTKRTDIHRSGAIVPADYEIVLSYAAGSHGCPPMGINCESEPIYDVKGLIVGYNKHVAGLGCCVTGLRQRGERFAAYGSVGKCTACGANYVYGDVWRHEPTGEHIHVGHQCAQKYELLADRSAFELALGRRKQAHAVALQRAINEEKRTAVLQANPGLEEALTAQHHIIADIRTRFVQWCELSPKQIALVMKLADEIKNPAPPKPEEKKVPAPSGRVTFQGLVISEKEHESMYGTTLKITVKVQTPDGAWLAWGTAPSALLAECRAANVELRGQLIELTATLSAGRDPFFAFAKRPVGKLVKA